MTRIDIAHGAHHRLQVAAHTVSKNYRKGRPIWVFCTDDKRLQAFSKLLWSIQDIEFIPHQDIREGFNQCLVYVCRDNPASYLAQWQAWQASVQEEDATGAKEVTKDDTKEESQGQAKGESPPPPPLPILLNLDLACPPDVTAFQRVLEIVSTHPGDQQYARERIKQYRQQGLQTVFHALGES